MKKFLCLSLVCLAGAAALMFTTLHRPPDGGDAGAPARVALLAANETGTFYMQLKQGAQDAAENLSAALAIEIIGVDGLEDRIAELAEDGMEAAIVYCEDGKLTKDALSALRAADIGSVTLLGSEGDRAVLSDLETDARALADAARAAGCDRALLAGENAALAAAFANVWNGETLAEDGVSTENARPGDCIIALTAEATRAAMARTADIPLFGVDTGETRAEDLETGMIDGMLLPRPYAMGYRALEAALASGKGTIYVPAKLVTPGTMYLPENVGIVYPLIQ